MELRAHYSEELVAELEANRFPFHSNGKDYILVGEYSASSYCYSATKKPIVKSITGALILLGIIS